MFFVAREVRGFHLLPHSTLISSFIVLCVLPIWWHFWKKFIKKVSTRTLNETSGNQFFRLAAGVGSGVCLFAILIGCCVYSGWALKVRLPDFDEAVIILNCVLVGVFFEEVLFRGFFMHYAATRCGGVVAVFGSALLFFLSHWYFSWYHFLYFFTLGVFWALVAIKAGLIASIASHYVFDIFSADERVFFPFGKPILSMYGGDERITAWSITLVMIVVLSFVVVFFGKSIISFSGREKGRLFPIFAPILRLPLQ